jgi:hypothetical protein
VLFAYGEAQRELSRPDARHRIEHCQTARDDQLDRMKALGVTPSFFVGHVYYWGDRHRDIFLGPERAARISPLRSALSRGLRLTLHSDTPVTPVDPLLLVWAAVDRRTRNGEVLGPQQRISVAEALRAVTLDAAWQNFEERDKGSIEAGKLADFVVLAENPVKVESRRLKDIAVLETIVGGETVYRKQDRPNLRAEGPELPKPASHTVRKIEGWTVRVDDRFLQPPNEELGVRVLKALEAKLANITRVFQPDRLAKLQNVTIVLDLTYGKMGGMVYHPGADWLQKNGFARDLARCVHIPLGARLIGPSQANQQPWVVLHELAHAYHNQVLGGGKNVPIREAYEAFKKSGHGEQTLSITGQRVRHYALRNPGEFFAEMTEAYFGMNDYFPFNRAELMTAEPEIYKLMQTIWGPVQTHQP